MFQTHIFIITRASFNFLRTSFCGLRLSHDFIIFYFCWVYKVEFETFNKILFAKFFKEIIFFSIY